MTDTEKLKEKIEQSGYKLTYLANQCGLTYQGFLNKVRNETEFTAHEMAVLKERLGLTAEESCQIFFNEK